jgi:mannose-6-phosphate isomerase-like protein (cupin superfamily)
MSYPPPRYEGEKGEVSAVYRPAGTAPDLTYTKTGNTVHYLATAESTNGLFGLYRWDMGPAVSGPDPHFHRTMTESFYVLLGTIRIYDGTRWVDCTPGDWVHVPEGGVHGFRNESGEPASMLLHFSPAGPREGYFEGLQRFATEGRPGPEEVAAFYAEHDNIWV